MQKPGDIQYRESLSDGAPNYDQLKRHGPMLRALRAGPLADGGLLQLLAKKALRQVADGKASDSDWALGSELDEFTEKIGKRLRAMLRDVQQGIYKSKGRTLPEWLAPFVMASGLAVGPADEVGVEVGVGDASAAEDVAASPASPPDEPNPELQNPAVPAAAPEVAAGDADLYFFAWDDEEQLAYRKPCGNLDAKPDWCKKVSRPGGSSDVMDAVAVWQDGATWKIPGHTVGDALLGKAAAKDRKVPEFWNGEFHTDKSKVFGKAVTSKDKASISRKHLVHTFWTKEAPCSKM
jgi:hypothetical protein